jgi:hypothetical protein
LSVHHRFNITYQKAASKILFMNSIFYL